MKAERSVNPVHLPLARYQTLSFFYVTVLIYVILSVTAQGQADYSAAWAAYYQQLYQQQAAVAAGQAAPGMMMKKLGRLQSNASDSKIH